MREQLLMILLRDIDTYLIAVPEIEENEVT